MKKLGFLIAFSALFTLGLSAQTTNPSRRAPVPRSTVAKPQAAVQTAATTTKPPAKNTVAKRAPKKQAVRAAKAAKPATLINKQKQLAH
jgi:hypothetical protein